MDKQIVTVDATQLNAIQNCFKLAEYSHILNLRPITKSEPLEKGDLLHKMLEAYYRALQQKTEGKRFQDLTKDNLVDLASLVGRVHAVTLELPLETSTQVIEKFRQYSRHYKNDNWIPKHVEKYFSIPIFEDENFIFLYQGKIDLVVEIPVNGQPSQEAIVDHKSTSRSKAPHPLNNQFMGYCWALGKRTVVKNEIGFQATAENFRRFIMSYTQVNLDEWQENTIAWIKDFILAIQNNNFKRNFTSCDNYGSCQFTELCYTTPETRKWKMDTRYTKGEKWDPVNEAVDDDANPFKLLEGIDLEQFK